jgi:hypothetical protein
MGCITGAAFVRRKQISSQLHPVRRRRAGTPDCLPSRSRTARRRDSAEDPGRSAVGLPAAHQSHLRTRRPGCTRAQERGSARDTQRAQDDAELALRRGQHAEAKPGRSPTWAGDPLSERAMLGDPSWVIRRQGGARQTSETVRTVPTTTATTPAAAHAAVVGRPTE